MKEFLTLVLLISSSFACENVKQYEDGEICVCSENYCDNVPELLISDKSNYQLFTTSKRRTGFHTTIGDFIERNENVGNKLSGDVTIEIMPNKARRERIIGFGGSFTDSTGINVMQLPEKLQKHFLDSYFGGNGIGYTLCRLPIGGSDFSTRAYSYCDVEGDEDLEHFKLQPEDFNYKIPLIRAAKELMGDKELKLFGSAWTAPPWMKTNNNWTGIGTLKPNYFQLWTDYYIRFLSEYEKFNVTIWGITTGNEPLLGFVPVTKINAMALSASQIANWIGNYLGPTLEQSKYSNIKLMLQDETRLSVFALPIDEKALKYVDGVAFHWYFNKIIPPDQLKYAQTPKKHLFIISSEACIKKDPINPFSLLMGSWTNAEAYIEDIMEALDYGGVGWVDWNMALDLSGGPTYINNFVQSSILVDVGRAEFYKQPTFYALGHFSKFILPGSIKVDVLSSYNKNAQNVSILAFKRPDGMLALILFNQGELEVGINVFIDQRSARITIEPHSISTFIACIDISSNRPDDEAVKINRIIHNFELLSIENVIYVVVAAYFYMRFFW